MIVPNLALRHPSSFVDKGSAARREAIKHWWLPVFFHDKNTPQIHCQYPDPQMRIFTLVILSIKRLMREEESN
jgi:hypothetical protein